MIPAPPKGVPQTDAHTSLQLLIQQQEDAWNRGNSAGFAAPFTMDADFVNIRGDLFQGRDKIVESHNVILSGSFRCSHVAITIRQLTEIAPDIAVLDTDYTLKGYVALLPGIAPTTPGVLKTRMKYVARRKEGRWEFTAAQNTAVASPTPNR